MSTVRQTIRRDAPAFDTRTRSRKNEVAGRGNPPSNFVMGLLTFNLFVSVLLASLVVHLGIENARRSLENIQLLSNIQQIKANMTSLNKEEKGISPTIEANCSSLCHLVSNKALKMATEALQLANTSSEGRSFDSQHRHYRARFNQLLASIRSLEESHDFIREQVNQRLGVVESRNNALKRNRGNVIAFHAVLSKPVNPTPQGGIIGFDDVTFNQGAGFDFGVFRAPVQGVYVIMIDVVLTSRRKAKYAGWERPLNITLRVNHKPTHHSLRHHYVKDRVLSAQLGAILWLGAGNSVDVFAHGYSKWALGSGSTICGAMVGGSP